jgi:hypothetical protein
LFKNFIENQHLIKVSSKIIFLNFGNPRSFRLSLRPQFLITGWVIAGDGLLLF